MAATPSVKTGDRDKNPTRTLLPVAAILTAALLWGGSFSAMRDSLRVLSPWSVMWLRMAVALAVLVPLTASWRPRTYRKGDWRLLLPMVLLQPCLYFLLESNALRFTTSSQAGVIAASVPLWVALGAWWLLSETVTRQTLAGLFISMAGVVGLTLLGGPGGQAENPVLGNILEVLAMACAALGIILVKQLSRRYSPWTLTAFQVIAGFLFFSPGIGHLLAADRPVWTARLAGEVLFLGAAVTLGAFGLYNWGMSRMSASRASVFINLVPVNAVLIGWLALGEGLSLLQCVSGLAVIGGVWLSQRGGADGRTVPCPRGQLPAEAKVTR